MCTYLAKRGATYYFRRAVPAELRSVMGGRVEFMVSLKTKDRDAAKRLIPAHTLATDGLLTDAVAEVARAAPQSPGDAVEDTSAALTPGETEQAAFEAEEAEAAAYRYAARAAERLELRRKLATLQSVQLPMEMQAMRDLLREHQHHSYRMAEGKAAIMEARQLDANRAATDPAGPSPMLDPTVIYLWAAERKPTDKTVATHRAVVRWFYERIGNKGVADITRQDVLMFKAKLLADGTSTPNVKIKLSRLRTLLQWAADNDYAKENVAAGITIKDATQAKNKRIEFDLPALTRIFSSPVYAMASRPAGGKGEAAHWLPLLALFTGARLEELGQLRVADVQELTYPDAEGEDVKGWFIHIREDKADALTLKNAASERNVPIHPELERLGFLRFVSSLREGGETRLFHKLKPDIYGRLTAKWGEWFGPYLRKECAVPDKRMVFHSFRHTFKQYARHANITDGIQRQMMGHSSGDVADQYGSGYPLHRVVEGMNLYRVPGLRLPSAWQSTAGASLEHH